MSRKILIEIRRGVEANLTAGTLTDGEFGYTTDTKKLFIGYGGQNICIGAASSLGDMLKSIYDTDGDGIVDKAEDSNTVGGKSSSSFATAAQGTKADNALPSSSYTASDILTKLKTVDGSASGLDADTVDGKNAADFAPSGYGLGGISTRLSSPDLNSIINNGWYDCQTPTNYVPDIGSNWHKLLVIASADTNYVTQIAFSMVNQTSGSAWIREKRAGTWGNWARILTSSKQCSWNDLKGV